MPTLEQTDDVSKILAAIETLNQRLASIEQGKEGELQTDAGDTLTANASDVEPDEDRLEFQIGRFWLARAGIIMLTAGFVFLLTLPYGNAPSVLPSLLGCVLAAGLAGLARFWRSTLEQFATYLLGGGLAILYFSVLRLAHFTPVPVVTSPALETILLLVTTAACIVGAWRNNSVYLMAMSLTFGFMTAMVSGESYAIFSLLLVMSAVSVYVAVQRWMQLLWYAAMLAFCCHVLWFVNNPVMTLEMRIVTGYDANLVFLLGYIAVFAYGTMFARPEEDGSEPMYAIFLSFLNTMTGLGTFVLIAEMSVGEAKAPMYLLAALSLIAIAIVFWVHSRSIYSTFHYAMSGYLAASAAIVHAAAVPDIFLWLCLQSLLVISTAVWFRSRIIVVANFAIYLIVFIAYLVVADAVSGLGLVFGVTALVSARILNWQRDRLTLKTDAMRVAYLLSGTVIIPLSLYAVLPAHLVAVSWLAVAVIYYGLSRWLRNKKYRLMALATLLATVAYVMLIGMSGVAIQYRVLSFVGVGLALLIVSALYFRAGQRAPTANTGGK